MTSRKHGRARGSSDSDGSDFAAAEVAARSGHTPELRLSCASWRSFTTLQKELCELDVLSLPLSRGQDGAIALSIEAPDGEVLRLPACLIGGVADEHGMPETLLVRVDLDDSLRERLAHHAEHASALLHDDVEAISRLRGDSSVGAYHVSTVSKRRARRGESVPSEVAEPVTTRPGPARDSQRPTQRAPSKRASKPPTR